MAAALRGEPADESVEVKRLDRMPYLSVLTYPRPDIGEARSRIAQLSSLGVERVTFEGRTRIGRLGLVGIGTVGVVVKGTVSGGEVVAVKLRRTDANRATMEEEFRLTRLANRVRVGAPAYGRTSDVMTMRYVGGPGLEAYVRGASGRGTAKRVRGLAHSILNQCRKLDLIGLDHGQLSNLRKHVVMEVEEPWIIDFESASLGRAVKNVTTAAQFLFVGGALSARIRRATGVKDPAGLLESLRRYKREMSDENYVRLLMSFGVAT